MRGPAHCALYRDAVRYAGIAAAKMAFSSALAAGSLVIVALLVAALWLVFARPRSGAGSGGGEPDAAAPRRRDSVLLVGPSGAGKTVLLHQVSARGRECVRTLLCRKH